MCECGDVVTPITVGSMTKGREEEGKRKEREARTRGEGAGKRSEDSREREVSGYPVRTFVIRLLYAN